MRKQSWRSTGSPFLGTFPLRNETQIGKEFGLTTLELDLRLFWQISLPFFVPSSLFYFFFFYCFWSLCLVLFEGRKKKRESWPWRLQYWFQVPFPSTYLIGLGFFSAQSWMEHTNAGACRPSLLMQSLHALTSKPCDKTKRFPISLQPIVASQTTSLVTITECSKITLSTSFSTSNICSSNAAK